MMKMKNAKICALKTNGLEIAEETWNAVFINLDNTKDTVYA